MVISWKHCGRLHGGVLNSKLKFQHDFFFFIGLRDQSQYRWLEVMQIHATPSLKHKNVLISNFLCKHCYRDRMMSLWEQQQKDNVVLCSSENKVQLNSCLILSWCFWCCSLHLTRISQESFHIPIFQIRIFISFNTCQMKYRRNAHALAVSSEQGKTSSQCCRQVWDSVRGPVIMLLADQ